MAAKRRAQSPEQKADANLEAYKKKFVLSQDLCMKARVKADNDQDYYDGKQWTDDEKLVLKGRKQPALVFNEVKPGVNGIIGIVERGKTDPRAYGRGKNDSDSAEVATDCLRYVSDKNRFQNLRSQAMKDFFIPGIVSCVVEIDEDREVVYRKGRYEAFFYDPYSREPDFSDARWLGLANWTDEDDALSLPWVDTDEKRAFVTQSVDIAEPGMGALGGGNETTEDRPKGGWAWGDNKKRRLMVVQMWHRKGPIWHMCVFVSAGVLQEGPSEYKDDKGRPTCNLIAQSCYVDRDNERYGVVRDMLGPQDAMNKGWSKAVHILNTSKLRVDPSTQDIDDVRAQWARPDGIIVAKKDQAEEIGDKQLMPAHMEMLNLAEQKMRRQTPTPGIVGRNASSQSGKAILAEQQAGMTEQAPTLGSFDDWTLRIYRMTWACIKQYWDAPKYIRVTDDENAPRYVLLNQPEPVTDAKGWPQFETGPNGQPLTDPQTGQPVPKMRLIKPAELDVDIIVDSTPDTATLQEDQYKGLLELATVAAQTHSQEQIPFKAILQASSLPKKRQVIEAMEQAEQERAQQPQQPSPEMAAVQAKSQAQQAQMQLDMQMADHKAQLSEKQAVADYNLKQMQAQHDADLAQKEFALQVWKAQQDAAVKREAVVAQIGLDQELAAHEAMMNERRAQAELQLKNQQQQHEQQLTGEKHKVETQRMREQALAAKGQGGEGDEAPKPPPKRVAGSINFVRGKDGKPIQLDIEHVLEDGTSQRQSMKINRNAQQPQTVQ